MRAAPNGGCVGVWEGADMASSNSDNPGKVAAFTPGPWAVIPASPDAGSHPNHSHRFVGTANWTADDGDFGITGEIIAKLTDSPAIEANARLIAAAPDLYAALKESIQWSPYKGESEETPFLRRARAAIRAVEGGAQ